LIELKRAAAAYPPPSDGPPLSYGTAGFRTSGSRLGSTVFRCGALMALRAMKLNAVTGLMITASHNPEEDNGVKLVEPLGEMLVPTWEEVATAAAQATSTDDLLTVLGDVIETEGIQRSGISKVVIAYDTRPSSVVLAEAARKGIEAMGAEVEDLGLRTTPQLHFAVRASNLGRDSSEGAYYSELADAFRSLVASYDAPEALSQPLIVDAANGVGALKLADMNRFLEGTGLSFDVRNSGDGVLNSGCGSDHVHTRKMLPAEMGAPDFGRRCASVDGDADRVVFFQPDAQTGAVSVFDGDKIACLAALLVKELVAELPSQQEGFTIGVVQTAYANGASTKYIRESLAVPTAIAKTGVKYVHAEAVKFDVGIYFESNGHGTVVFSPRLVAFLEQSAPTSGAAKDLLTMSKMINQAVGDAISGLLMVECALRRKGWTMTEWDAIYSDLSSRQLKVRVKDRSVVMTTADESQCTAPAGVQAAIDDAVGRFPGSRSFVRPSGTEDVVRVYAEAPSQKAADSLAAAVAAITFDLAGGVGDPPGP